MPTIVKRPLMVSGAWIQAAVIVLIIGFFIMGVLTYYTYHDEPPIPDVVKDTNGAVLFTRSDIMDGQQIFLGNGLMQYGSVFGHGAYLGPDFTAEYLHRAALSSIDFYGGQNSDTAHSRTIQDFKTNRFDQSTGTLLYTDAQVHAFEECRVYYATFFGEPTTKFGLRPKAISDAEDIRKLTAFFSWTAWSASTARPGHAYSYTNNWPPEPLVDNHATADSVVWSVLSLIALLGGTGLLLGAFGRWNLLGWHGREQHNVSFRAPDEVELTPAQNACAWFFFVMAALFVVQTLLGGATEHYRAELQNFFGIDLGRVLPFNLVRTWHLQLSIFWVATSYLAAGIFLAPMIVGREPRGQKLLAYGLLGALVIVVVGSLLGEFGGIRGLIRNSWFGDQGFEWLDLGRIWQILLTVGLLFWVVILYRGLRGRLSAEHAGNMPWLFVFSALSIPAFYAVGLLANPGEHFTTTEFWRFWVVHLWVEDFLELFTTILVAYTFVLLGVVHERTALRVIYLDIILYSAGGIVGTMHHVYFSGEPAMHMALGAFFSAAEVIPLTFLTVEAWSFLQLGAAQGARATTPFPHYWAVMFLASVGFWNFLGAGVFGFLINLPIVSYYEIGTALTANHAHASFMGVYGMLSIGLALFCLRYIIPEKYWSDKAARISFWSLNLGLAWMVFATLFPLGILQLYHSISVSYYDARTLNYIGSRANSVLEWLRMPGDFVFILGGTLPILYLSFLGIRHMRTGSTSEEPKEMLFTDVVAPAQER
ncbi:nitric-oxide reductase large subunit [Edaphobacter aggregans]|uniref:nitric-oxide reductase large subunit n=1 Tax=Edaphobacter aggregans TaxID=570835 RepID=UPI00054FD266|nr:cbb3-type cytochrome c oxidase subunit I [Edaphobacter aggregans]